MPGRRVTEAEIREFERLYADERLSLLEVAKRTGFTYITVQRYISALGIMRPRGVTLTHPGAKLTEEQWQELTSLFLAGESRRDLAVKYDIATNTIWDYFQRHGIPTMPNACDLCGKKIRSDNEVGVCLTPGPCQREYGRRKRMNPARRERVREYARQKNREGMHEDLTYLYYSPGLRTHKIGHTTNLKGNEMSLRRGCWDIQLIETFPGGHALEQWLHDYFADRRVRGEWFRDLTAAEVKKAVGEWPGLEVKVA